MPPNTLAARRPMIVASQDASNGYAMGESVAGVLTKLSGALPGGRSKVQVRQMRIWHRVAYAPAGTTALLQFFNVARAVGVTNLEQPNQFPANYGFAVQSIGFRVDQGVDITGTPVAVGAESNVAAVGPAALVDQKRLIIENGEVNFVVGDKPVLKNVYGLDAFPSGRGIDGFAATATTASFAGKSNNGAPFWANRAVFDTPWPIPGGQQFSLTVQYQNLLPLTGGGVILAEMVGLLVSPAAA